MMSVSMAPSRRFAALKRMLDRLGILPTTGRCAMVPFGMSSVSRTRSSRSISLMAPTPTSLDSSARVTTVSVIDRISRSNASVAPSRQPSIRGTATSRIVPVYRAITARWKAGCIRRRCRWWKPPSDSTSPLPISRLARPNWMPFSSFLASFTSACLMESGLLSTYTSAGPKRMRTTSPCSRARWNNRGGSRRNSSACPSTRRLPGTSGTAPLISSVAADISRAPSRNDRPAYIQHASEGAVLRDQDTTGAASVLAAPVRRVGSGGLREEDHALGEDRPVDGDVADRAGLQVNRAQGVGPVGAGRAGGRGAVVVARGHRGVRGPRRERAREGIARVGRGVRRVQRSGGRGRPGGVVDRVRDLQDQQVLATGIGEDQFLVALGVQHEVPGELRRARRDDQVRVRVGEREGDLRAGVRGVYPGGRRVVSKERSD